MTAPPVHDANFYTRWNRRHDFCAACGRSGTYGNLTSHHIVKQGRSDEACNLLRVCLHPCHDLAEGLDVRGDRKFVWLGEPPDMRCEMVKGDLLPKITLAVALSMKRLADPKEYNAERLQELRGCRLPDPEPIPDHFLRLLMLHRPELIGRRPRKLAQ